MRIKYSVGVDPGINTGLALWDGKSLVYGHIKTVNIINALHILLTYHHEFEVTVYIEDPNQNKPVFGEKTKGQNFQKLQKIAQNVGSNKRDAQVLIEWCQYYNIPFKTVRPTTHKWDAEYFKRVTGMKEAYSQHARDAARLVYGR